DLAINTIGGRLVLLHNASPAGHWLDVRLARFAPGAVVRVTLPDGRTVVREVHAGSSYLSSEDPRVHFGLGPVTRVPRLTVHFPGGSTTRLRDASADRIVTVGRSRRQAPISGREGRRGSRPRSPAERSSSGPPPRR